MKKILFVINSYSIGGITLSLRSLLNSPLQETHQFSVFAIKEEGNYISDFKVWSIGENYWTTASRISKNKIGKGRILFTYIVRFFIRFIAVLGGNLRNVIDKWTINRIERKYNFDYIVAFSEGEPAQFVAKFINPHKIAWIHCDYMRCLKNKTQDSIIYDTFEKIICVSQFTKRSFISIFPHLSNKTTFIYNLLDKKSIREKALEETNHSLFVKQGFTIISIGRICEVKRYRLIPKIAKKIKDADIFFRWYIIGPKADPKEYKQLIDNISLYDVREEVILLGGIQNPYPYFKQSDLLVSLSWSEACPMIFNEARVLNLPIVSTDFGSSYEFIDNNHNGIICSLEDLAFNIIKLIQNKNAYNQIQNNLQLENYNDRIIKDLYKLFL